MVDRHIKTQPDPNRAARPGRKDVADDAGTKAQPKPNISTEHQKQGDAARPNDTLDRAQDRRL